MPLLNLAPINDLCGPSSNAAGIRWQGPYLGQAVGVVVVVPATAVIVVAVVAVVAVVVVAARSHWDPPAHHDAYLQFPKALKLQL